YLPKTNLNVLYIMLYVPVFVNFFNILSTKINGINLNWTLVTTLFACTIGGYLIITPVYFDILADILEHKKINPSHFSAHWISDIFIGLIFYRLIYLCKNNFSEGVKNSLTWIISGVIVAFLSFEFCLISEVLFYSGPNPVDLIQTVYIKTALPVLWGLLSFILMWLGMRNKQRTLRIISLSLFSITLIKLFLFDINNIPVAGKIAAFFCLGVLLLIISFMYQKVKKIIVDDEAKLKD
ncbi:MAG TPA: DUF2339 domain-containing protein, partial [Mucilaginibacter sp.]